jgi:hypothetical protein
VRRLGELARELARPSRRLAPPSRLEQPRSLVREGLERMWEAGLWIGRQAAATLARLGAARFLPAARPEAWKPGPQAAPGIEPSRGFGIR